MCGTDDAVRSHVPNVPVTAPSPSMISHNLSWEASFLKRPFKTVYRFKIPCIAFHHPPVTVRPIHCEILDRDICACFV